MDQVDRVNQLDRALIPPETLSFQNDYHLNCGNNKHNVCMLVKQRIEELQRSLTVKITDFIDIHTRPAKGRGNNNNPLDKDCGILYHPGVWKRNIDKFHLAMVDPMDKPLFLNVEFLARTESFKKNGFVEFFPNSDQREYFELGDIEISDLNVDGVSACIMSCKNVPVSLFMRLEALHSELVKIKMREE